MQVDREKEDVQSRRKFLQSTFGALLIPAFGSSLLTACGGGDDVTSPAIARVATTPILASVDNFRDVAGADDSVAYQTPRGQKLRRGVFYRSNAITPSAVDLATLNSLGIKAIFDLRTPGEISKKPDIVPTGATYTNVNIIGASSATTPTFNSPQDAIKLMEDSERAFVTDEGIRSRFAQLFTALANGSTAQLFHCTAGKDRTGWAAAVLLTFVGVPQNIVIQDYLLTNIYSAASIQASYAAMAKAGGQAYADNLYPLLGVQTSFLLAGLDQVAQSYGSMDGYMTNGLKLDAATQAALKAKLLG
ncbi:tyrosine-protein phosphatase [Burkholderia vietnamiensis]|uniref:tyrosine-protein phosphatase n=1 Tax=Burkholderia vietnamiensis TaxID=60552 RepID=UPI000A6EBD6D|nr:tyrosine-protein phosphatase [Burkholderia vietnamiensis]